MGDLESLGVAWMLNDCWRSREKLLLLGETSFEKSSYNDTDVFVTFTWLHICFVGRKKLVLKETINGD